MKPAQSPPRLTTLILISGLSVAVMNIFLPSLSRMAEEFAVSYALMQFAISGYLGLTGVLALLIGPFSDRYGRRPVMLYGLVGFLAATLGCIYAPTAEAFLACRLAQAVISSGFALSRAIIRDIAPPAQTASLIGYVAMAMAVAPMLAPTLGGVLEEAYGWRASFWALFIAGVLTLAIVWVDLGETNRTRSASFTEQFRAYPALFRSRRFWGYAFSAAFASGAFFAFLGGAPFVAERVYDLSPAELGVHIGVAPLGYMLGNFISGRYTTRVGITRMMIAGTSVATLGLAAGLLAIAFVWSHPTVFFGAIVFMGLGNGLTMPSASAGALSVRPQLAGSAAGLSGALMVGGGAALSAVTGYILTDANGAVVLMGMMALSSFASLLASLYVRSVDLLEGALDEAEEA